MIDTLGLTLTDYKIDAGCDLQLMPSDINLLSGQLKSNHPLFIDSSGKAVEGKKAIHNAENFNFTIAPISSREPNKISSYVQFSVPKIESGSNYAPTNSEGTKAALKALEAHLKAIGVRTNIETAKLSRIDTFRNVIGDEPFTSYSPILQVMQGQRLSKRDYGTTYLWRNTQQEICVYDKVEEMKARKQSIVGATPNTIRFEYRLLNGKKIQKTLGMTTVADLLSAPDHVEDTYRKSMKQLLFKAESVPDSESLTVMEVEAELKYFLNQGGHWFERWIKANGMRGMSAADYEAITKAAERIAPNRTALRRIRNTVKDARMDALNLETITPSKKTLGELYTELQTKVLLNPGLN